MSWKRILAAVALVIAGALGSQPALIVTGVTSRAEAVEGAN